MIIPQMIKKQLEHKTIRHFSDRPISNEIIQLLFQVANQTATSNGLQCFSMIQITDNELRSKIAQICNQDYVNDPPVFVIFVVDTHRNDQIAKEEGHQLQALFDFDRFIQGTTDAVLAAQNMVNAAEALDLGSCYFGSILNDTAQLIELLQLPKLTMPILGVGIGYPDQVPTIKPRMPLQYKVFENTYKECEDYQTALQEYDHQLAQYRDLRFPDRTLPRFADQIISRYEKLQPRKSNVLDMIRLQGFEL